MCAHIPCTPRIDPAGPHACPTGLGRPAAEPAHLIVAWGQTTPCVHDPPCRGGGCTEEGPAAARRSPLPPPGALAAPAAAPHPDCWLLLRTAG